MKEGRIFLYVSPNVILPIMFLLLAVTSLAVHFSILNNTTWFADFWQGAAAAEVTEVATETEAAAAVVEEAAPAADAAAAAPADAAAAPAEAAPAE